ncbi:MAG: hypothetical protein LBG90_05595 [Spirochaetaceae bacterium]|jgi:hypothetical protein|nr:hypothetical protein [Spirochaetaceae bacterium]
MAVERHINFFELEKACGKPGCPLCRIVSDRTERYIDNMLFEHVTDRTFRKQHRLAGGFCGFHSRNLESFRDGLAVAILGRDILEDRISAFKKRKIWKPKETCPICAEKNRIEKEYLTFLAGGNISVNPAEKAGSSEKTENEQALRDFFIASEGLCAPHYGALLETAKRIPEWLISFHEHKFTELLRRTSQFIDLSAYGKQEEFAKLPEKDQVVWKELAVNLRGGAAF